MALRFTKLTENGNMETVAVEQRKEARSQLAWPVSVWVPEANRFFNGRSVNVSKGGAFISMPMIIPIRTGHEIEINFPRTTALAREKGQYARIKSAKVLRVERDKMLTGGAIGMAVQFAE
jgi:hypothetical protein